MKKHRRDVVKQKTKEQYVSRKRKGKFRGTRSDNKQQHLVQKRTEKLTVAEFGNQASTSHGSPTHSNHGHDSEQSTLNNIPSNVDKETTTSLDKVEIEKNRKKSGSEKKLPAAAQIILNKSDTTVCQEAPHETEYDSTGRESPVEQSTQDEFVTESEAVESGYRLIWLNNLSDFVNKLHRCKDAKLTLVESSMLGLYSVLSFKCSRCGRCSSMPTSCPNEESSHPNHQGVDVNRRVVFAALETGIGRETLATICELLELPVPVVANAHVEHEKVILNAQLEVVEEHLKKAREEARVIMLTNAGLDPNDPSNIADLAVSFDGTWSKRGYTANNGIGFAISADTGKVLDYAVHSKYCHQCAVNEAKLDNAAFEAWRVTHDCDSNHQGSSASMEVAAAVEIWERSKSYKGLRFRYMISDGDSKAYNAVRGTYGLCNQCKKYGDMPKSSKEYKSWVGSPAFKKYSDDHEEETAECQCVYKIDCVGHVQKRMGKHLRTLHKAGGKLPDGKSIKGASGRLTEGCIDRIQKYYGNAIRKNIDRECRTTAEIDGAVCKMKKSINAVLHHSVATPDATERHKFCPEGENSWCKYKRTGENITEKHHLDPAFLTFLQPTFDNLSNTTLLKRCLPGYTQNTNESVNGLVWVRAPKHKWHGTRRIKIAVTSAILRFNQGAGLRSHVMGRVNISTGIANADGSYKKDMDRVKKSIRKSSEREKIHRQKVREAKIREEEDIKRKEGQTYGAGAFDHDVLLAPSQPKRQKRN